ncbi:Uncharacterised protein [Staphylococcus muscae]|uniref:Uncharacterized protein n=1 Tax=Staphylococcus muscae TaxID=1294 RepID=A0A240C3M2_9STAP|nr:Uncharacterised protein [Staphylococcus muscae]
MTSNTVVLKVISFLESQGSIIFFFIKYKNGRSNDGILF